MVVTPLIPYSSGKKPEKPEHPEHPEHPEKPEKPERPELPDQAKAHASELEPTSTVSTVGEEVDWPQFWLKFKQYALWELEWYDGSEWVSVKEDLDVQLSYPQPKMSKINLVFDASHSGDYRLTFAINKVVRDYVEKIDKHQYELTYEGIKIIFDWSDCADISGLQFTHGVKAGYFWFRIRRDNVPLGAHVEIDPTTVATSTTLYAETYGFQRKSFYTAGLFWAFYTTGAGGNAGWEFSADGITWTGAFTSIGACDQGHHFSVWFDGTYIHYARYDNRDLFYRRGTPVNDGTITWSAVEQLVYNGTTTDEYEYPCISVDTNGYAWIGIKFDNPAPWDRPYVLKNKNNDGTWALDFAYELSAVNSVWWKVAPVPLTDGKVYVIYCRRGVLPLGNLYDAGWDGEETDLTDYVIEKGYYFSAVALGDNVHLVYNRDGTNQIRHNERVWCVGWDVADVLVQDAVTSTCGPALSAYPSKDELYCFWTSTVTDHVYYKKYSGGAWGSLVDWIDESTDDIIVDYLISSFYMEYGGYNGLLYVTSLNPPFNIRFAYPIIPPSDPELLFGAGFNSSSPFVELHWNHSLIDVQFFEVQNSSDSVSWDYLGHSHTVNYTDIQVFNGFERYYRERAVNQTGEQWYNSSWSDVNFEKVYFIPETAPGTVTVDSIAPWIAIAIILMCVAYLLARGQRR